MSREIINPAGLPDPTASSYNHALVQDGTLYVSGQVGVDEEWNVVDDDVEAQARQAYRNVRAVLDEVDRGFADVAKVRTYLVDLDRHREAYGRVWEDVFDEPPYPCHVMLGVDQLASEAYLVEVEVEVPLGE